MHRLPPARGPGGWREGRSNTQAGNAQVAWRVLLQGSEGPECRLPGVHTFVPGQHIRHRVQDFQRARPGRLRVQRPNLP